MRAPHTTPLVAPNAGFVADIDALALAIAVCGMGAGRAKTTDAVDHAVGLQLCVCVGDEIAAGATWMIVHHRAPLDSALLAQLSDALVVSTTKPTVLPRAVGLIAGSPATFTEF